LIRDWQLAGRMLVAGLLLLSSACTSQPVTVTREPVTLRLVAADSCGPLVEELSAAYEEIRPWVTVTFTFFNSTTAERALRSDRADLALLSWLEESPDEGRNPLWSVDFARDGVAVIVHPDSPITEIGLAQLQEIFRGRLQSWHGTVLTVVSREEGSGTRAAFESVVMGGHDVGLTAVVMPSSEAVMAYVASTPSAIGYVSSLRLDGRVRVLPVEGVPLTAETIEDGSYPLSRALYLVSTAEPSGEAREFAQWMLGAFESDPRYGGNGGGVRDR